MNQAEEIFDELAEGRNEALARYLKRGGNPDLQYPEWNCTILFPAVLMGDLEAVKLLVEAGADVNAVAGEPGCDILAETALSLAMQLSFLQDKKKFNPVVEFLESNGAKDEI